MTPRKPKAIVIGVGPVDGLGAGLARRFAAGGHHVLIAGRTRERINEVAAVVRAAGGTATAVRADAADEADVSSLFDMAMRDDEEGAPADLVAYNAGNNRPMPLLDITAEDFEAFWRFNCFGGFLVARESARRLAPLGRGTVLFTGASGSLRGSASSAHFAASKAGLRMIAQSMAREFGPRGLHVAHVIVDGGIDGERLRTRFPEVVKSKGEGGMLSIPAIAEVYWQLHLQQPSAWTQEMDLRPFKEAF
jgi:NAD(P)-dependent dehydrogenase (short-subunit alcohol dehydrogenase family)